MKKRERHVVYYSSEKGETTARVREIINDLVPANRRIFCHTIGRLRKSLCKPLGDLPIGILMVSTRDELQAIVGMGDLLDRVRIILILPDSDEETVRKGHTLRPRFIAFNEGNYDDLFSILRKMLAPSDQV